MKSAEKPGQILILVLLVVVVSLAVGLSVASRNITNIRTSTQTDESQKAFSAAEGGIENVLSQGLGNLSEGNQPPVNVGNLQANVNVTKDHGVYIGSISPGQVLQLSLDTPLPAMAAGQQLKISWGLQSDSLTKPATLEITEVYGLNSQERYAYYAGAGGANETFPITSIAPSSGCGTYYSKCVYITLHAAPHLVRIRGFWATSPIHVVGANGGTLPTQVYTLKSTASTADGITRTVQVTKTTLPQVPAVFDYAVYSDQAIIK